VPLAYPPSVKDSGGRVFRATKQTKHNKSAKPNKKPEALDPRLVPNRPALLNSATSAAHANSPLSTNSTIMHDTTSNNNLVNETFSAKRRRLLSTPSASAVVTTNLLHNFTGGTIRAASPDVGSPAASPGLGSPDEMDWLTRMFHPPN